MSIKINKKRILFCITDLGGGGAEKTLVTILNHMSFDMFAVTLLLFNRCGININNVPATVRIKSLFNFTRMNWGLKVTQLIKKVTFRLLMTFPQLFHRCFIGNRFDTEIFFIQDMTYLLKSANSKSYKIAWIHTNIEKSPTFNAGLIENLIFADKIVCVSNGVRDILLKHYPVFETKTTVIYNLFNIKNIISKSNAFSVRKTKLTIVSRTFRTIGQVS